MSLYPQWFAWPLLGVLLNSSADPLGTSPGTNHILIGHRKEVSIFPGKSLLSSISLFMRDAVLASWSACCNNSSYSPHASHLLLGSLSGSTEAQRTMASLGAHACSLVCLAGLLGLQLQAGVLLAYPVHCGSCCSCQLWHLSSYSQQLPGGTSSVSSSMGEWMPCRWALTNSRQVLFFPCHCISICSFWGCPQWPRKWLCFWMTLWPAQKLNQPSCALLLSWLTRVSLELNNSLTPREY